MILVFLKSLEDSSQLCNLYSHCVKELKLTGDYSDLLRMSVTYCMSALDKLIHDLVVFGMVEIYSGRRPPTDKYLNEQISVQGHMNLNNATVPPAVIVFEGIVQQKISYQSFLDPQKLVDALSLIWAEPHKWQAISLAMGRDKSRIVTELKNIYKRRNSIVHEADIDPSTNKKMPIQLSDAERIEKFIKDLGQTIHALI